MASAWAAAAASQFARTRSASAGRAEHRDVGAVARQPAGDRLEAAQLELDLLAGPTRVPARPDDPTEAAQPVRPALGHPHPRGADHRRRARPRRAPWPAGRRRRAPTPRPTGRSPDRPDDARHPERARRVARSRSCPTTYHRPRQDTTPHGSTVRRATSPAGPPRRWSNVTARPDCTAASRGPNAGSPPRTRGCARPWSSSTSTPAARSFTNAPCAGAGQLRGLPQPRGERHGGRLVGLQVDLAELVVLAGDAVAVGGVDRVPPALQRHAELAQLVLVALEHPEERLVVRGVGVAGHDRADALGRQELARGQQAEHQVHQTLCPCGGHVRHRTAAPAGVVGGRANRAGVSPCDTPVPGRLDRGPEA